MAIIGNIETADKFVIYKDDGSIEWVPLLKTAKEYVKNPNNKNWYNKDIYATYENVIKLSDGRLFLQSQKPEEKIKVNNYEIFSSNIFNYIENQLINLVRNFSYSSFENILSWKDSKIKEKADLANKVFEYRDNLYEYANTFLNKNAKVLKKSTEPMDFSNLYDKFLENIPLFK